MNKDIKNVLISEEKIQQKVKEIGEKISEDYKGTVPILVGVLNGAVIFMADLMRHISIPVEIEFMAVSSYGSSTESSGIVRILKDLEKSVEGRHIIVVEDIVDSGLTLKYLKTLLKDRKPASIKLCSLLDKPDRRRINISIDYKGFCIPDEFVVGYGLDYDEKYRNLPYICVLKPEVYQT